MNQIPLILQFSLQTSAIFLHFSQLLFLLHELLLQLRQLLCLQRHHHANTMKLERGKFLRTETNISFSLTAPSAGLVLPLSLCTSAIWDVTSVCNFTCGKRKKIYISRNYEMCYILTTRTCPNKKLTAETLRTQQLNAIYSRKSKTSRFVLNVLYWTRAILGSLRQNTLFQKPGP